MTNEEFKSAIQKENEKEFRKYASEKLIYLDILRDMGYTTDQAINIMIWFDLEEVNNVLGTTEFGDIAENISALADCVAYIPPNQYQKDGYYIFRIGGSVDAGTY